MKKYITYITYIAILLIFLILLHIIYNNLYHFEETYLIKKKNKNYPKERLPCSPSRVKRRT